VVAARGFDTNILRKTYLADPALFTVTATSVIEEPCATVICKGVFLSAGAAVK